LAVVGALLNGTAIKRRVGAISLGNSPRPEMEAGEVVTATIGLLYLGEVGLYGH
jgi:hypothetical protein